MEKEIFKLFMRLRFSNIKVDSCYYKEWKTRFMNNPIGYMDLESMKVLSEVLHLLYLNTLKRLINS